MTNRIVQKINATAGGTPAVGSLLPGELAVRTDVANNAVWVGDNNGDPQRIDALGGRFVSLTPPAGSSQEIVSADAADTPLTIRGAVGQTDPLLAIVESSGSPVINARVGPAIVDMNSASGAAGFRITTTDPTTVGFTVGPAVARTVADSDLLRVTNGSASARTWGIGPLGETRAEQWPSASDLDDILISNNSSKHWVYSDSTVGTPWPSAQNNDHFMHFQGAAGSFVEMSLKNDIVPGGGSADLERHPALFTRRNTAAGQLSDWIPSHAPTIGDTFPAQPVPGQKHFLTDLAAGSVGEYIYADTGAGIDWVRAYDGTQQADEFHDPTNTASFRVIGRTLECWGEGPLGEGTIVTYPRAFAREPSLQVTHVGVAASTFAPTVLGAATDATQFEVLMRNTDTDVSVPNVTAFWRAIGEVA